MSDGASRSSDGKADRGAFATTHWSLVVAAGDRPSPLQRKALEDLCKLYWYPLYAFVRREGYAEAEARDLTQSFFADLLQRDAIRVADRARGRFRTFLLTSLRNFAAKTWRAEVAQKRGGGKVLSLDFGAGESSYRREPVDDMTPERVFQRRWAMILLETANERLRAEYEDAGRSEMFSLLKAHLGGHAEGETYREIAERLGTSEGAVKVAAHRMRKRFRELLRDEIAQTVAGPSDVDDELRELFQAVRA